MSGDAAIRRVVGRTRRTARSVPEVDPDGPGEAARVLMILREPGELGALTTGYLSLTKNTDATARNQKRLMREAGLRAVAAGWPA